VQEYNADPKDNHYVPAQWRVATRLQGHNRIQMLVKFFFLSFLFFLLSFASFSSSSSSSPTLIISKSSPFSFVFSANAHAGRNAQVWQPLRSEG